MDDEKLRETGRKLAEMLPKGFYGNVQFNFANGYKGGFVRQDFIEKKPKSPPGETAD